MSCSTVCGRASVCFCWKRKRIVLLTNNGRVEFSTTTTRPQLFLDLRKRKKLRISFESENPSLQHHHFTMLLFCPNLPSQQSPAQSNRQHLLMSLEKASELSADSSATQRPPKRRLPSPGKPISILDFAEMTMEEQKTWLQVDQHTKSNARRLETIGKGSQNVKKNYNQGWVGNSAKKTVAASSVETDSALPALDDSSISEESQETNSISSTASSSSVRSDDALVEKRSIFGPYWGQGSASSVDSNRLQSSGKKQQVPRRVTAFPRPPSPITSRHRFLTLPEEKPAEHKVMTLLEELSFSNCSCFLPEQKARSMPSILRRSNPGGERRPIRRSQSVSFDARVDVIVYQELPPQGERPWWLSLRSS